MCLLGDMFYIRRLVISTLSAGQARPEIGRQLARLRSTRIGGQSSKRKWHRKTVNATTSLKNAGGLIVEAAERARKGTLVGISTAIRDFNDRERGALKEGTGLLQSQSGQPLQWCSVHFLAKKRMQVTDADRGLFGHFLGRPRIPRVLLKRMQNTDQTGCGLMLWLRHGIK